MIERKTRKYYGLRLLFLFAGIAVAFGTLISSRAERIEKVEASTLSNVTLDGRPDNAKSRAAFNEAVKVFFSARCINCHPAGDGPLQGDKMVPHTMDVKRGSDGRGMEELKCTTCHQEINLEGDSMPPGAPNWHMPPENQKMVFQGLTARQLCVQLKDPKRNGGRKTPKEAIHHLEEDPLVTWAWTPGNGRSVPPMSYEDFMKAMNIWVQNGAACPE